MKNLKKLLVINHANGKSVFKGIFITYLIFVVVAVLNKFQYLNNDELFKMYIVNQITAYFFIATTITLLIIPLPNYNRKLLLSHPIDNTKLYPLSLLIYNIFVFLSFFSVLFIIAIIFNDTFLYESFIWLFDLLLLITIVKSIDERKSKKSINTFTSGIVIYFVLSYFLGIKYDFIFSENYLFKNISIALLILLSIIFIINSFLINNKEEIIKTKSKDDKKIKDSKVSKLGLFLKMKSWSKISSTDAITLAGIAIILIFNLNSSTNIENKIFLYMAMCPIILISIYDIFNFHDIIIGIPVDIIKLHISERFTKLIIFLITNVLLIFISNLFYPIFKENNYSVYIGAFLISSICYSFYEILYTPNGLHMVFIVAFLGTSIINTIYRYFINSNTLILVFALVTSIIIFVFSFYVTITSVQTGTSILLPAKKSI